MECNVVEYIKNNCTNIVSIFGYIVKSFNFVGTKFYSFTTLDMFMAIWICGFQIICNITKENKYFVGILNL